MLFSSPLYPLFLIAVFFLYALGRWGGPSMAWARLAIMVLLGDVLFLLVGRNPDAIWDPLGGALVRLLATTRTDQEWPPEMFARWALGASLLVGAICAGRRGARWISSDRGQQWIARGFVAALAAVGAMVLVAWSSGTLDVVTSAVVDHGHLLVLAVLGIGFGASQTAEGRVLGRVVILFVASSLFYHAWAAAMPGPYRYLLALLLATIVLDYYLGLWIQRTEDPWRRKALLIVSLVSNLGILVFFKYTDFFTQDVLGLDVDRLNLILPAGISFHTFQSLSYTIDVYRKEITATRSVVTFATFVLFFPQLVAGPIVRARDLLPQLENPPALELAKATHGLYRIVLGLFKKIAIADTLALSVVDRVFEAPERFSSIEVVAGVVAYALQIFLDFSAYSDIAIGSAAVLGFTMPENFRTPYRSSNLQEFWRRWHISLSTWLRDYLYITLGGSKGAPWRTYVNLILTMLIGGLWHGASWVFIVWGALHGLGLAVTRFFQRATHGDPHRAWSLFGGCAVLAAVGYGFQRFALPEVSTWTHLVIAWLYLTPLWAVVTAWLGREQPALPEPVGVPVPFREIWGVGALWISEVLRILMCVSAIGFFGALAYQPSWTWIPLIASTWMLGVVADAFESAEIGSADILPASTSGIFGSPTLARLVYRLRRQTSVLLVFAYVCLAWIFFRASSFDNALAILRQIALLEGDRANLVPMVTVALAAGFATHFFADGSYRWLRARFVELPTYGQGLVLACAALVLRELAHTKIVPFIYFQF
ncbi:MAG: MBOAT family protein [Deltaproteobacteria bacterium]|nr:MBOAT family protein [Deltaproteobacteria bacterium]